MNNKRRLNGKDVTRIFKQYALDIQNKKRVTQESKSTEKSVVKTTKKILSSRK